MIKKIVLVHTDLRIYWPARIHHFYNSLDKSKYDLNVIEITGHGGNYNFERRNDLPDYWECLFFETPISELKPINIKVKLHQRLNELNPDFLIAGAITFPSGANSLNYSIKHNIPIIIFDDAKVEDFPRSFFVNWFKKQLYLSVDAIFCPAPQWNATFNFFGFRNEQLFHGVDVIDNYFFQKNKQDDWLLDITDSGYFLNIGRQIEKKNLLSLLIAYNSINIKIEGLPKLVLVGDGNQRNVLEAFVKKYELEEKVIFLPFLPQEKIRTIYKHASVFILPSTYGETWGLVVNEAMASGLPVIVSNKVGCAEVLVQNGENGFIFNIDDILSLETKLLEFYVLKKEEKNKMSRKSLSKISDWDLNKFSTGLLESIFYVENKEKKYIPVLSKFISGFWKGRYKSI